MLTTNSNMSLDVPLQQSLRSHDDGKHTTENKLFNF